MISKEASRKYAKIADADEQEARLAASSIEKDFDDWITGKKEKNARYEWGGIFDITHNPIPLNIANLAFNILHQKGKQAGWRVTWLMWEPESQMLTLRFQ